MAEENFWALNSIVVQPGYAAFREALRQFSERLFAREASEARRARLRAATAAVAGILICLLAILILLSRLAPRSFVRQNFGNGLLGRSRNRRACQQRRRNIRLSCGRSTNLEFYRCSHGAAAQFLQVQ